MQRFHRSTKCGRRRRTNSARISHPPLFRRVTKKLVSFFPTVFTSSSEVDVYLREISKIQIDPTLLEIAITDVGKEKDKRFDHWWAEVMPIYGLSKPV